MTHTTRRRFMQHAAMATVGAASIAGLTACQTDKARDAATGGDVMSIIDTHQHLWDLTMFQPPWLADAPAVLNHSYVTSDYVAATRGLHVVKAVYMEIDVAPAQEVAEAHHLIALAKSGKGPTVAGVISGRPNEPGFDAYIRPFAASPYIKGVRQVLHADSAKPGLCLQPQFVKSVQLLGELGLSFDVCIRPRELGDAVKLADQCPGTRLIIDHCGNGDPKAFLSAERLGNVEPGHDADGWRRDMSALAERPNVICKISGIVARAPKDWGPADLAPIINHCLDAFGPDRVVFGGDWPVCLLGATYAQWVAALKDVIRPRPTGEQRRLLHDNAERLYRLA
jgi:predicted TIM-barrel fold metal-dependent hydrolase